MIDKFIKINKEVLVSTSDYSCKVCNKIFSNETMVVDHWYSKHYELPKTRGNYVYLSSKEEAREFLIYIAYETGFVPNDEIIETGLKKYTGSNWYLIPVSMYLSSIDNVIRTLIDRKALIDAKIQELEKIKWGTDTIQ